VYLTQKAEGRRLKAEGGKQKEILHSYGLTLLQSQKIWQKFFYEATPCAACAGWRICMGKYAKMKDKTGCQNFTIELLNLIESMKAESKKESCHL
jgi:hypothetical protein